MDRTAALSIPEHIAHDPAMFGAHLLRARVQLETKRLPQILERDETPEFVPVWYIQPNVPETTLRIENFQEYTRECLMGWLKVRYPTWNASARKTNMLFQHMAFLAVQYGIARLIGHISEEHFIATLRDHLRPMRSGAFRAIYQDDPIKHMPNASANSTEKKLATFLVGERDGNISKAIGPVANMLREACGNLIKPHTNAVTVRYQELRSELLELLKDAHRVSDDLIGQCMERIVEHWNRENDNSAHEFAALQAQCDSKIEPSTGEIAKVRSEYLEPLRRMGQRDVIERAQLINYLTIRSILEKNMDEVCRTAILLIELLVQHRIAPCDYPGFTALLTIYILENREKVEEIRKTLTSDGRSKDWP